MSNLYSIKKWKFLKWPKYFYEAWYFFFYNILILIFGKSKNNAIGQRCLIVSRHWKVYSLLYFAIEFNSTIFFFLNKVMIAHISYITRTYLPIYNKSLLIVVDDVIVKNEIIRPRISMLEALPLRISWKFILK